MVLVSLRSCGHFNFTTLPCIMYSLQVLSCQALLSGRPRTIQRRYHTALLSWWDDLICLFYPSNISFIIFPHSISPMLLQFRENVGHVFVDSAPLVRLPEVQPCTHTLKKTKTKKQRKGVVTRLVHMQWCHQLVCSGDLIINILCLYVFIDWAAECFNSRCLAGVKLFLYARSSVPDTSE